MEIREKVANLPTQPGVYLFRDAAGNVLYVGKAQSLRNRVRSYFLDKTIEDAKTGSLVREVADFDFIVVDNEKEALALENNLIKQHKPKFNVLLRDDKTYPYIRYTAFEKYPRVYVTRRLKTRTDRLYFGPYFPASLAYRHHPPDPQALSWCHRAPSTLTRAHPRPCLQYYIHRCLGPCVKPNWLTTDERYAEAARDVRLFLEGRRNDLTSSLEKSGCSARRKTEKYEEAAGYRDLAAHPHGNGGRGRKMAAASKATTPTCWHGTPSRRKWR
jgi:excinuclease ABC subunit C